VCAQVIGNDAAIAFAGAAGNLELNVMMPVMARNVLESVRLLAAAAHVFTHACVVGIEADAERCRRLAEMSPAVATALVPRLGYDAVADVVKQATREGKTAREVVIERGLLSADEVDAVLDVLAMTRGGEIEGMSG
jgi:fumarate hydratase class II